MLDVASRTGGQVFRILLKDSLGDAFKHSIADFRMSYVLQYVPQGVDTPRPGWHDVVVRSRKRASTICTPAEVTRADRRQPCCV